jgi:hypothetical protein
MTERNAPSGPARRGPCETFQAGDPNEHNADYRNHNRPANTKTRRQNNHRGRAPTDSRERRGTKHAQAHEPARPPADPIFGIGA